MSRRLRQRREAIESKYVAMHSEVHRLWVVAIELQPYRLVSNPKQFGS